MAIPTGIIDLIKFPLDYQNCHHGDCVVLNTHGVYMLEGS